MSAPFILGQKATIIDGGAVYSFCVPAAEQFGLKNFKSGYGIGIEDNTPVTIVSEPAFFSEADATLIGVEDAQGNSLVVDVTALSA